MSKKKKNRDDDRLPRRVLVAELAASNERVVELANKCEDWRARHTNAMRKMNAYERMLHSLTSAAAATDSKTKEMLTWPLT